MTRLLKRLRAVSRQELLFRGREAAAIARELGQYQTGRARWRAARLAHRLRTATPVLAHAKAALQEGDTRAAHAHLAGHFGTREHAFPLDPRRKTAIARAIGTEFPSAALDAVRRADRVIAGHYDLLGYTDLSFRTDDGNVDWHLDPVHGRRAPSGFWRGVPFLEPGSGDHKIIWELNRHQHWLALGRAAWLSGNPCYKGAFVAQLRNWRQANPPLTGINWASMLELAFRSLSWLWALHFFVAVPDDSAEEDWLPELLEGLARQLEHVERHLSVYFSPNTHLLGEALALYVAGSTLPELTASSRWTSTGRRLLLECVDGQVNADGGHAELSLHYHRYALDFYLLALTVARRAGDGTAATAFAEVTARLATFCRALADHKGRLATIGDDDGGLLFPICGREPADASDTLSLAASLLDRPELAVSDPPEETLWMLGGNREALARPSASRSPGSRHFPDTGYVVMRSERGHAVLDAGPHGFLNGGHAHADALSLVLTANGRALLIDPGTATYTMDASLRDRFRSSAMHNTVLIDGRSQSIPRGPFHWRTRARAHLDVWRPGAGFDYAEATHDGYAPLIHRRAVLRSHAGLVLVVDHFLAPGRATHTADAFWHFAPGCSGFESRFASTAPEQRHYYGDHEGFGWYAPVYGQLVPAPTLRCSQQVETPASLVTAILEAPATSSLDVRLVPVRAEDRGWHHVGLSLTVDTLEVLAVFSTPLSTLSAPSLPPQGPWDRAVVAGSGTFTTDARVAVLRLESGEPESLMLVDGRTAQWSGGKGSEVRLPVRAANLQHDFAARRRLSHDAAAPQR